MKDRETGGREQVCAEWRRSLGCILYPQHKEGGGGVEGRERGPAGGRRQYSRGGSTQPHGKGLGWGLHPSSDSDKL